MLPTEKPSSFWNNVILSLGLLDARLEGNKLKKSGYKNITGNKIILNKSKQLYFSIWMAVENLFWSATTP